MGPIRNFMDRNYRHFNAGETVRAAQGYIRHLEQGGKMMITLGGAMSTAELGITLAEMIRQDKVHAITCTGANLEEDVFNLVAHDDYRQVPDWRNLSAKDEEKLLMDGFNRVTDCAFPETVIRDIQGVMEGYWKEASATGKGFFPYEYFYRGFEEGVWKDKNHVPWENSWLYAAWQKKLPIFTPGWEDSTLGNIFSSTLIDGITKPCAIRTGPEQMVALHDWYLATTKKNSIGFFQIGGGIAGDFPICVVPMIRQDLEMDCPLWGYFCQITDATTSYGGYSGAGGNEKITWEKLAVDTPKFEINSDATIVAPLIFAYILGQ
ncbi:MAG: deoxyhypusine synthase family protein [Deltaproteobacteria bacterium]|nr:deoxyhypusine synthase family protein [Deltaproteobacteria bacterium]